MRRPIPAVLITVALLAAACGDDDDGAADDTTVPAAESSPTTSAAPPASIVETTDDPTATTGAPPTAAAASIVPGADADVDAVVAAYSAVFDSAVPYDQKVAHLIDAEALRPTIDAYGAAGERFGGITLVPTAVTVDGESAEVTYDVLFDTTPQYQGLDGTAVRDGGSWKITRNEFCAFMSSARTPCETP